MSIDRREFPPDDDGEVLFNLARDGNDLSKKRMIVFSCYARSEEVAARICEDLRSYGYDPTVWIDDADEGAETSVSVYADLVMLPDYELLILEQKRLDRILSFHETHCDGWYTESTPQSPSVN